MLWASLYAGMTTDSPSGSADVGDLAILGYPGHRRRVTLKPAADEREQVFRIAQRMEKRNLDGAHRLAAIGDRTRSADKRSHWM